MPRSGVAQFCDPCRPLHRAESKAQWVVDNPELHRAQARIRQRRHRHALEFGDGDLYAKCTDHFGEECGICGALPEPGFHQSIDHDHETGEIRGLLCPVHNTGMGYFRDDAEMLLKAAAYLVRDVSRLTL